MPDKVDVIVVGCGAIGAAAAYWLSRRLGSGVLGLDQYEMGHARGASEDHSRIIRHSYSSEQYTALTPAAFQSWGVTEQATGLQLVHRTGGLIIAHRDSAGAASLDSTASAMRAQNLPFEELSGAEVSARWPQWRLGRQHVALFDPESGILDIRRSTAAHLAMARDNGARIVHNTAVTALAEGPRGVTVTAGTGQYLADRVILAGGAWNPVLLGMLGTALPITLTAEQVTYFATAKVRRFTPDRFPVYGFIDTDDYLYYGFPIYGEVATKAGIDSCGPEVSPGSEPDAIDPARVARLRAFLGRYLPEAVGPELYSRACRYDFPPDRDFIIDYVPGHDRVLVCAGAGHAGKFAALLGRIASELAIDGASRFAIDGFRTDRPALTSARDAPARANSL